MRRVLIVGAGIGGLSAALLLAARGVQVTLLERAASPGGKMRQIALGEVDNQVGNEVGNARVDAGPTVFTMRWVFEQLFDAAGTSLDTELTLQPAERLARHAWSADEVLDLYADVERSTAAVEAFAGAPEAQRFRNFTERAQQVYRALENSFIRAPRPNPFGLVRAAGLQGLGALWNIQPFVTLYRALGEQFRDARLRQLFARYATYCGSSPFRAPATLMLVAHVEREGVWLVRGGIYQLALALARVAQRHGAALRYEAEVREVLVRGGRARGVRLASGEELETDAVIVNADVAALSSGLLGAASAGAVAPTPPGARSLSAVTWAMQACCTGFTLAHHNVFFSRDYAREFEQIFRDARLPEAPTVYLCAQDRGDDSASSPAAPERLLMLVNAPPAGDVRNFAAPEIEACAQAAFALLEHCGLRIERDAAHTAITHPADFHRLFPATGGALYGRASHGWRASFQRPGARTKLPGLYVAGGSTHPGPGVPMAALSGQLAAAACLEDAQRPRHTTSPLPLTRR